MKLLIQNLFANLIIVMISLSCHSQEVSISWKSAELPLVEGKTSPGFAGSVVGISNGFLVVGGGANFPLGLPWEGGKKTYHNQLYVFRLKADEIDLVNTTVLPVRIAYAACITTPGGVIVAGGENENGPSEKVYRLKVNEDASIQINSLPNLPFPLTNAAIAAVNEKIFIAGGETKEGVSNELLMLDPEQISGGWQLLSPIPHAASHAVMVASGKTLFLAGGRKKDPSGISELYNDVYQYDPKDNRWSAKSSLPYALSAGTGIGIAGKEIVLFGGDRGETFHQVEQAIAEIDRENNTEKKQVLIGKKNMLLRSHPGFSRDILMYSVHEDKWKIIGSMPYATPVTTTVVRCGDNFYIPSGEIRAGVRSPLILAGKISIVK
jgi:cyclically-permuted mutarotase family protein